MRFEIKYLFIVRIYVSNEQDLKLFFVQKKSFEQCSKLVRFTPPDEILIVTKSFYKHCAKSD
jgi:hypothetical protein